MPHSKEPILFSDFYGAGPAPFLELYPARDKGARLHLLGPQGQPFSVHLPPRVLIVLLLLWRARCRAGSGERWPGNLSKQELHKLYIEVSGGSAGIDIMSEYVCTLNVKIRKRMALVGWGTWEECRNVDFITTGRSGYGLGFDQLDLCDKLEGAGCATDAQLRVLLGLEDHRAVSSDQRRRRLLPG